LGASQELSGQRWSFIASGLLFGGIVLGPYVIYYFGITAKELSVVIGAVLIGLTIWAVYAAFTSPSSTGGLKILWVPFIGYPLVLVAVFIDWLSR
jgi:hypothetical protein